MKLTNQELINILNGLIEITEIEMPISLAYKFNTINAKLTEQYKIYEQTMRQIEGDKEKVEELLNTEFETEIKPIGLNELIEHNITIKPRTLYLIDKLLEE